MRKLSVAVASIVGLAGCQTWGPTWSELSGQRYTRVGLNVAPVLIEQVDGQGAFPNQPGQPIKIEPGRRTIVMQAAPLSPGWAGGTNLETMVLDVEPCKRYYINGRFENPLGPQWSPFIDYVETIAGCSVAVAK